MARASPETYDFFAAKLAFIISQVRDRLAAAPPDKSWRVALDIVEVERWPHKAAHLVRGAMLSSSVSIGAQMLVSMMQVLCELEQCFRARYPDQEALPHHIRKLSLSTTPEQLQQPGGLLEALQYIFTEAQEQRQRQGDGQPSTSCTLGHGPDCPAHAAIAAAAADPTSAHVAPGVGPPCRSCLLAHAELLAACSALLRFWPDCVLQHTEPVAWSWVTLAAECALDILQDVSTAILQHQLLQEQQRQPHAASKAEQQPTAPPADVVKPGLAAVQLLAAVCFAAAYPKPGELCRLHEQRQLCERGVLDHPCMLPSMLAVGAAAVLGQEMQRRLRRTTAAHAGCAEASCSSSEQAACDAAASRDHSGGFVKAAACGSGSGSGSGSSMGTSQPGSGPHTSDAAWQLVCVTEQWAGGQLLPQPFTLLVEALGCSPKAFLLLACIWQQQQQAGSCSQPAASSLHAAADTLAELSKAYQNVFTLESAHILSKVSSPADLNPLQQRMVSCAKKGQQQPQQFQQHLQLALLLMREALRGARRGMFQPVLTPIPAVSQLACGSFAARCASCWLLWAQIKQAADKQARGAPKQQRDPWDVGGEASSAAIVELLQGHCLLLREGVRELQVVSSSWAATRSSSGTDSTSSPTHPELELTAGGAVTDVDHCVGDLLRKVQGLLRCLTAATAVDSGVLQQAAPQLFGLAGTLERIVRLRCTCHCPKLLMRVDVYVPRLLQFLLTGMTLPSHPELRQGASGDQAQQQRESATAAACAGIQACGLLPFLVTTTPLGSRQQRQLLGLLFSALKLFSAYPTGLYAFSWSQEDQVEWLEGCCDIIRAACMVGRVLLVSGGQQNAAGVSHTGTQSCSHAGSGSSNGTAQPEQQQHQQTSPRAASCSTGGCGNSRGHSGAHSCGLGAEGTAALLPWVVLQGRALQLWVALFRAYVQLAPQADAEGSKAGAKSSKQDADPQPFSLVGSAAAIKALSDTFRYMVMPNTQLLAAVLQGMAPQSRISAAELLAGVAGCGSDPVWLRQQLLKRWMQLFAHSRQQDLDLKLLRAAIVSAASAAAAVMPTFAATGDSLQELGDSADEQRRLRQSDVRRYLKSWQVTDAAVLKGVTAMLSSGEHSTADVAVAAWLCSPSIAGNLLASLQDLSTQLSTLPIHEACNNPNCRVTMGSREQGLVCGKACVCGGCGMGHYCSRACQREHWPVHQLLCGAAGGRKQ